ncbi:helix-turn-helix domain-containing protein [Ferribacterium limneticum]|uniref:hypothetical protein n=1 Tax=Ferribacterium limneticum TaxID=76259 RepID=UPI001CFA5C37|nr:hypothetical protein [Ferribacterium limneticum]UCV28159.1 hypothetical protein KI617_18250 [Ferribacterium limneticum]UCV32076.1 hypothetical protein KI608_18250 [Ferribacterium limneticum]
MSKAWCRKTNWVLAGWNALHRATLDVGAEVSYERWEFPELRNRPIADTGCYQALVQPLVHLLDQTLETPSMRAEPARILVWRKLRVLGRHRHPDLWRLLVEDGQVSDPVQEYHQMQQTVQSSLATIVPMSPILAARHGYKLIWQTDHHHLEQLERLLWGLALIGWSAHHWKQVATCELCFRFTRPGSRFCYEHTQSQTQGSERSAAYRRYRLGRKVHHLAEQRGKLEFLRGNLMLREARRRLALSDVIFEWEYEAHAVADELRTLHDMLSVAPCVLRKLDTGVLNLDFETLTEILRETLDPYHWDPMHWGLTILQAELWFSLEEESAPGKRGHGLAAQVKIDQAKGLINQGVGRSQIARELGVSPSAVSKWIARRRFST